MDMTAYRGRYAELYDLFYGDKSYRAEAAFVDALIRSFDNTPRTRLLELACGTGSHALAFENLGYHVVATDLSDDMLAQARRKSVEASSSVTFLQQDMQDLDVPGAPFDVAICLFDSIGFARSNEAILSTLRGVCRHLARDGLFICDFWHAAAMLKQYEPMRISRWRTPSSEIVRVSETSVDCVSQIAKVIQTVYEFGDDGWFGRTSAAFENRCFFPEEMASLLAAASLMPLRWYAGFSSDEPITSATWHVLSISKRRS